MALGQRSTTRKEAFGRLLKGATRIVDFNRTYSSPSSSRIALQNDWKNVGHDIDRAVRRYTSEQNETSNR